MKKITVVAVGKIKEGYFLDAIDEYTKRLSRFCTVKVIELPDYTTDSINKESELILSKAAKIDFLMDIGGELVTSEGLSELIENGYHTNDNLVFVIGGSNGVNGDVKERAVKRLSFGRITYPHKLMRVVLLEQIYRAFTISNNLPYHK